MLKVLAPFVIGVSLLGATTHTQIASVIHKEISSGKAAITKTTHPISIPRVAKTTTAPKQVPTPGKNVANLTPTTPAQTVTQPAITQPVTVTPKPGSGVSSLVPAPSNGSGSSSSSSSSTTSTYTSTNWSGYLVQTGSFTQIAGTWTVPLATGNGKTTSADATWVGIGGVTSNDLIQAGTLDAISASGQLYTTAFYELLPNAAIPISSIVVNQGDSISANINETSTDQWSIEVKDNTSGATFNDSVSYTSTNTSAEWIEEDPSYSSSSQIPLDTFGKVSFTGASTTNNNATQNLLTSNASSITLVDKSGNSLATPSAIGSDGASFTVTQN